MKHMIVILALLAITAPAIAKPGSAAKYADRVTKLTVDQAKKSRPAAEFNKKLQNAADWFAKDAAKP